MSLLGVALFWGNTRAAQAAPEDVGVEFFEKKIRPILADHCYNCHSAQTKALGGLRVDDHNGLLQGGKSGPAVVPGQPQKSQLLVRVNHADDAKRMPQNSQLSREQVADLELWIKNGAV